MKQVTYFVSILLVALLLNSLPTTLAGFVQVDSSIQPTRGTTPCLSGYGWSGQSCVKCMGVSGGHCECSTCGGCTKLVCDERYTANTDLKNPTCTSNICPQEGCADLSCPIKFNAQICTKCKESDGYLLLGFVCVKRMNCLTFDTKSGACSKCTDGYYKNWDEINQRIFRELSYNLVTDYYKYFEDQCSPCMANCLACDSMTTCTTCKTAYYWDISTKSCQACGTGCTKCTDKFVCTECQKSGTFYLLTPLSSDTQNPAKDCRGCQTAGCLECALKESTTVDILDNQCTKCNQRMYLDATTFNCVNCGTYCDTCSSSTDVCSTCYPNAIPYAYIKNDKVCKQCTIGCNACDLQNDCPGCYDGYYLTGATPSRTCKACSTAIPNCNKCSSESVCTMCQGPITDANGRKVFILSKGKCLQCPKNCPDDKCIENVVGETVTATCSQCLDTFYLDKLDATTPCKACSTFTNTVRCTDTTSATDTSKPTQCADNYFLAKEKGVPVCKQDATPPTCCKIMESDALSNAVCMECLPGKFLLSALNNKCDYSCPTNCLTCVVNPTNNGFICSTCITTTLLTKPNYLLSADKLTCSVCTNNCRDCKDQTSFCTSCIQDKAYFLDTAKGTCTACTTGCKTCTATICTECYTGFLKATDGLKCTACTPSFCLTCVTPTTGTTLKCTACNEGYYLFDQIQTDGSVKQFCRSCPDGCKTCPVGGNICTLCNDGYVKLADGCVSLGAANCLDKNYDSVNGCTTCQYGFYKKDKFCVQCVNPYSGFVCAVQS